MLEAGALALLRAELSGTDGETMLREIYLAMAKAGEEWHGLELNGVAGQAWLGWEGRS